MSFQEQEQQYNKRHTATFNFLCSNNQSRTLSLSNNLATDKQNTQEYFQDIIKKFLIYQKTQNNLIQPKVQGTTKIRRKPRSTQLILFQINIIKVGKIMTAAYNGEELRQSQLNFLQQCFKLNKQEVKQMNPSDPKLLQTLRYLIFNKQKIPNNLIKVVDRMAKTHMVKQSEPSLNLIFKKIMFEILIEEFQPPLDIYIEFLDAKLIQPTQKQLIEVFTCNQFFFQAIQNNREIYSNISQKKRLIYNQFPYLLDIFSRLNIKQTKGHTISRFKLYLSKILGHLQLRQEGELLERYLPEVKCRYLKIKLNLSHSDLQFLFLCLKNIGEVSLDEFQILYSTKSYKSSLLEKFQFIFWINFNTILQLCSNSLTKEDFHLSQGQLEYMGKILNFQKCLSIDVIMYDLIMIMLREQSYKGRSFSKSILKNIQQIFKSIPDKKKKKQCCYILLTQIFNLIYQNPQKKKDVLINYSFPEQQMDNILDEGRCIAIDVLLSQEDKNLVLQKNILSVYMKIVKKVIIETKNKTIRTKAIELQTKLSKANNIHHLNFNFYLKNLPKNSQLIQLIQIRTLNGQKISEEGLSNVYRVLNQDCSPQIRRRCLRTIKYLLNYHKNDRWLFTETFSRNLILSLDKLYFQQKLSDECKVQILNLTIQSTNLAQIHRITGVLINFFYKVYVKSTTNSNLNINSCFGIYTLVSNINQFNKMHQIEKESIFKFLNRIYKNYKIILQPNIRSNINILCAIAVLAKKKAPISPHFIQKLTDFALKNKDYTELVLLIAYFNIQNSRQLSFYQNSLINICQILKQEDSQIAIGVLQKYFQKQNHLSYRVIIQVNKLSKTTKNQRLYTICKQILRSFIPEENVIMRRSGIPIKQFKIQDKRAENW